MTLGQLQRLGAITGIPSPPHNKTRALLAGLVALAQHTTTPVRVIAQLASAWEIWTNPHKRAPFQDLLEPITARVTVLYVSRNTNTPQRRDAALVAWERANALHDRRQTEWQAVLDADHKIIYQHAAERLSKIFADKEHYIHQKAPKHQGKNTKQYKKQLGAQCQRPWQSPQHRWTTHRSGYQCGVCGLRIHQALTVQTIEDRLQQACPQLTLEAKQVEQPSPHQALPKKLTRVQVIHQLLAKRHSEQHQFEETTGYLRCGKCGCSVHKRINEAAFTAFLQSPCLDRAHGQPRDAHSSHQLWRKGDKVSCKQCGLVLHLDGQQRVILTGASRRSCKGAATKGSPLLPELFRQQAQRASATQATLDTSQDDEDTSKPVRNTSRPLSNLTAWNTAQALTLCHTQVDPHPEGSTLTRSMINTHLATSRLTQRVRPGSSLHWP